MAVIVVLLAPGLSGADNSRVGRSQGVDSPWAQGQKAYQRRADLIPNLVATVSGAANFEKTTLTEITQAQGSVGQVKLSSAQASTDPTELAACRQTGQLTPAVEEAVREVGEILAQHFPRSSDAQNHQATTMAGG